MRIALVISSLGAGGAERVLSDMANYWASKGWVITLITISGDEVADFYPLNNNVQRIRLGLGGDTKGPLQKFSRNVLKVRRLRQAIHRAKPDAVISFMDVNNVLTLLATTGLGLNVIVSERIDPAVNSTIGKIWALLRTTLYRHAAAVVGQTAAASKWLTEYCRARAVTIANPLRQLPLPATHRQDFVLSVGRLEPQKGFDTLLHAFAGVHNQFPDWRLVILGEGPQRVALNQLARSLGISSVVDMPGNVTEPEVWMARAGLVVQASRFEGFPNVLMEAMAMGAPVIATDCRSGPAELIHDQANGRLVPVDDVPRLAEVMAELMADGQKRGHLGLSAIQIRARFSQDKIMPSWEALLAASKDNHA